MHCCASIDEEHCQRAHALGLPIWRRVTEKARMRFEHEATAAPLLGGAFRYDDWGTAAFRHRQGNDTLFRTANPM